MLACSGPPPLNGLSRLSFLRDVVVDGRIDWVAPGLLVPPQYAPSKGPTGHQALIGKWKCVAYNAARGFLLEKDVAPSSRNKPATASAAVGALRVHSADPFPASSDDPTTKATACFVLQRIPLTSPGAAAMGAAVGLACGGH